MPEDKRFIVWYYDDDPVLDDEEYQDEESFNNRNEAEASAKRMLKAGTYQTAILTNEEWTELLRWTADDFD